MFVSLDGGNGWEYVFPHLSPYAQEGPSEALGDYHTIELSFVFDNQWPPVLHHFGTRQRLMADAVGMYWGNMAKFSDPNGGDYTVRWPPYGPGNQSLFLDVPLRLGANAHADICAFWATRRFKWQ